MFEQNNNKTVEDYQRESVESLNRSIRTLAETEEITHQSMEILDHQGEQICRMTGKMGYINAMQDRADKYLRSIGSFLGSAVNKVGEYNPVPSVSTVTRFWRPDPEDRERLAICDIQPVEVTKIDKPDQIDQGLDTITLMLRNLKREAIMIGEEIDRHNNMLCSLSDYVDDSTHRLEQQTDEVNRLRRW